MEVRFYTCTCDNRVVDKSSNLLAGDVKDCHVYNQTGIMHPSLLLTYSSALVNYNYMHIPDWGRYYYIVGMEVMPGGRIVVSGSEDVLMSNKNEIQSLNAYVVRTENASKSNKLVSDSKHPVQANRHCKTIDFPGSHFSASDTDYVYLLTVVGGSSRS